jgi:hypothetical protein
MVTAMRGQRKCSKRDQPSADTEGGSRPKECNRRKASRPKEQNRRKA